MLPHSHTDEATPHPINLNPLHPLNADTNIAGITPSVLELGDLRATGALQSCIIAFHWSKLTVLLNEYWADRKHLKYLVLTNNAEPCFLQLLDRTWSSFPKRCTLSN